MKNLDSSWKYTTKVGIAPGELLVRESLYRQGASEFQEKALSELNKLSEDITGLDEVLNIIKGLKP